MFVEFISPQTVRRIMKQFVALRTYVQVGVVCGRVWLLTNGELTYGRHVTRSYVSVYPEQRVCDYSILSHLLTLLQDDCGNCKRFI